MDAVSESSVETDRRSTGLLAGHRRPLARAALIVLLAGLVATVVTIAAGAAFSASDLGGVLLLLPSFGALVLAGLALLAGRSRSDGETPSPLGSSVALASFGLLLFGCSWAVLVHNL
jgi:hypothetical protein